MSFSLSFRRWRLPASRNRSLATPARRAARRRWARPVLDFDRLEGRVVLSRVTIDVTSLDDSGPGTLRPAIAQADAGSPTDDYRIDFTVTGTIDLQSALPDLSQHHRRRTARGRTK